MKRYLRLLYDGITDSGDISWLLPAFTVTIVLVALLGALFQCSTQ